MKSPFNLLSFAACQSCRILYMSKTVTTFFVVLGIFKQRHSNVDRYNNVLINLKAIH